MSEDFYKEIAKFFGLLLLMVPLAILNGWALSILWEWFIVVIFKILPLSVPQAIGLGIVISFTTVRVEFWKGLEQDIATGIAFSITRPFLSLGMGWIVKQFM